MHTSLRACRTTSTACNAILQAEEHGSASCNLPAAFSQQQAAAREPVRTILSGPAGGVIGALSVARAAGIDKVLSFDMGGTSTDVALLDTTREPPTTIEGEVGGLPVGVPMLDIHTAGAGGGSLARIDASGALQVGPQSAGADPGPACYGRGELATVTDANLVLGRLHPQYFLGGAMRLDIERAKNALKRLWDESGGFGTVEELAEGIVRVANARMESALRRVSVERGHDPRAFALLGFRRCRTVACLRAGGRAGNAAGRCSSGSGRAVGAWHS